jgi:hypothetical protein
MPEEKATATVELRLALARSVRAPAEVKISTSRPLKCARRSLSTAARCFLFRVPGDVCVDDENLVRHLGSSRGQRSVADHCAIVGE